MTFARRIVAPLLLGAAALAACGQTMGSQTGAQPPQVPSAAAPALVQVENSAPARPQSGIQSASVVYEYLTEGGISRFSLIFLHPPKSGVGPIRSARLVSIALTQLYGAVLMYSGASHYVEEKIAQAGLRRFEENTAAGDLFRVGDRAVPHNLYTDGGRIADLLRRAHAPAVHWQLWPRVTTATAAQAVSRFRVPISFAEQPLWTYVASSRGYTRSEPGTGAFIDAGTARAVVASTVVVQQVSVSQAPEVEDVSGAHGVEQDVTSGGAAQVFTGGREYQITWSQPSSGPPVLRLKNGASPPIAPGLVWIELVPRGSPAQPA